MKCVEGRGHCREGLARARLSSRHARRIVSAGKVWQECLPKPPTEGACRIVSSCSKVCRRRASEGLRPYRPHKGLARLLSFRG